MRTRSFRRHPAPHDSYADFVAGIMAPTWLAEDVLRSKQLDTYFYEPRLEPSASAPAPSSMRAHVDKFLAGRTRDSGREAA